ncbi:MAG: 30S ribosomal protein S6 [Nitrospinota bacterium]
MPLYESLFMVNPELSEERAEQHLRNVQDLIARMGGESLEVERWGKKRLAYRMNKHRYGIYLLMRYRGQPGLVGELERYFRLDEEILKFITVRIEERRLRKEEEMRQKRAAAEARVRARRERAERDKEGEEEEARQGPVDPAPSPEISAPPPPAASLGR